MQREIQIFSRSYLAEALLFATLLWIASGANRAFETEVDTFSEVVKRVSSANL